jgi:hypothetical protein
MKHDLYSPRPQLRFIPEEQVRSVKLSQGGGRAGVIFSAILAFVGATKERADA